MSTYRIGEGEYGYPYIKCLICGFLSYHPDDIKNKYCGFCNEFHPISNSDEEESIQELNQEEAHGQEG